MEYRLMSEPQLDIIDTIFKNRNIEDRNKFLNVGEDVLQNPDIYTNMNLGTKKLLEHIEQNSNIAILVDSDADGFTSSSILYKYLLKINDKNKIQLLFHNEKTHGLNKDIMSKINDDINIIIIPDAGSENFEQHKILKDKNIDVIVIDHHDVEKFSEDAIVINNQLDKIETSLSGVGMTWKFITSLENILGTNYAKDFLDIVAVGMIADVCSIRSLETRYLTMTGMKNIRNKFLQKILENKTEMCFDDVGWKIGPLINSIIRCGDVEDKKLLFKALVEDDEEMYVTKIKGKGETVVDIYEYVLRLSAKLKAIQNKEIKEALEEYSSKCENIGLEIYINNDNIRPQLIGLFANKIASKHSKPALVLNYNEDTKTYFGSARSHNEFELKTFLINTNLFEFCSGHQEAFGVGITEENLNKLKKHLELIKIDTTTGKCYLVDNIYNNSTLNKSDIIRVASLKSQFCNGFETPLFAIELNNIPKKDISFIGKNKNTIKINYNGISFIKFFCTKKEIEDIEDANNYNIKIIGTFEINEWNNTAYPQVLIKDYEIKGSNISNANLSFFFLEDSAF